MEEKFKYFIKRPEFKLLVCFSGNDFVQKDSRVQSASAGLSVSSDGSTGRIQVLK